MDLEAWNIVGRLVGMLVALYPIGKGIAEWMNGKTSKMRDEYRFAMEFLSAINDQKPLHPFVLEKGYQALAQSRRITIPEAQYLLNLENSPSRLKDFVLGYYYVQHLSTNGDNEISFRMKFVTDWSRRWRKGVYLIGYVVLGVAAFSPLILAAPLGASRFIVISTFAQTLPIFGICAVFSIMEAVKIVSAERLVKLQRRMSTNQNCVRKFLTDNIVNK
ncbi:MAG: hypothetical protein LBQ32_02070 [Burkholderiaceae bacterium]|jgi:hypothetical protein|nr:hypothetical protein [Burkholderiaceae bacterium]